MTDAAIERLTRDLADPHRPGPIGGGFCLVSASDLRHVLERVKALEGGCTYCGPGVRTGLPSNACENCMGTGLNEPVPTTAWGEDVSGDTEELAWVWLNLQQDCSPADIDYSADQMVDAFMAGRASKLLSEALNPTGEPT